MLYSGCGHMDCVCRPPTPGAKKAVVQFQTSEDASMAMDLSGRTFFDRPLSVFAQHERMLNVNSFLFFKPPPSTLPAAAPQLPPRPLPLPKPILLDTLRLPPVDDTPTTSRVTGRPDF
jgi:hypothetical protein